MQWGEVENTTTNNELRSLYAVGEAEEILFIRRESSEEARDTCRLNKEKRKTGPSVVLAALSGQNSARKSVYSERHP
jgi:hypothetical protein